jgi:hypothetical protein
MEVVSFTPRQLYLRETAPGTHWTGGWVGPRGVLDAVVKRKIRSMKNYEQIKFGECLLPFCSELFSRLIYMDLNVKICKTIILYVICMGVNFVSYTDGRTQIEGVCEQGAEENI